MTPDLATAPLRAPERAPRPGGPVRDRPDSERPRRHLRSVQNVPDVPVRSGPRVHIVLGVGVVALFGVLFAVAVLQTVLVQGQIHLDGLHAEVAEAEVRVQVLRAEVAQLESPGRVIDEALAAGMVPADGVTSVVPTVAGGTAEP